MVKTSPFFWRGFFEKTLLELMISGYHYFPKHPYGNIIQFLCVFFPSESGNVKVQFKDDFIRDGLLVGLSGACRESWALARLVIYPWDGSG